jgi:hypothetical protein
MWAPEAEKTVPEQSRYNTEENKPPDMDLYRLYKGLVKASLSLHKM